MKRKVPTSAGKNADYIPELASFDPELYSIAVVTVDGQHLSLGEADGDFPIESCSKPFLYALACEDLGGEAVHKHVGREPSGVAFNAFTLNKDNVPHNACINSGAMMTASLFHAHLPLADRFKKLTSGFADLAGRQKVRFNQAVYLSEKNTAHRNFALAYFMKRFNAFPEHVNFLEAVDFYFQSCSIDVTCDKLAAMASTFANNGVSPLSGATVLQPRVVKDSLQLMYSCGLYDYSGEFAVRVGLPAKSGVSGCIYMVLPGLLGLAVWSPPLDSVGNSVRGIEFCRRFAEEFNCALLDLIFDTTLPGSHATDIEVDETDVATPAGPSRNNSKLLQKLGSRRLDASERARTRSLSSRK